MFFGHEAVWPDVQYSGNKLTSRNNEDPASMHLRRSRCDCNGEFRIFVFLNQIAGDRTKMLKDGGIVRRVLQWNINLLGLDDGRKRFQRIPSISFGVRRG